MMQWVGVEYMAGNGMKTSFISSGIGGKGSHGVMNPWTPCVLAAASSVESWVALVPLARSMVTRWSGPVGSEVKWIEESCGHGMVEWVLMRILMWSRVADAGHKKLMEERDEWAGASWCLRGGLMGSPGMWRWGLLDSRVRLLLALILLVVSFVGRIGFDGGMGVSAAWLGCGGVVMGTGGVGSSSSSDIMRSMGSTGAAGDGAAGAAGPLKSPNVQPVPAHVKM